MAERFMRAKMQVSEVLQTATQDTVKMNCVAAKTYGADGLDEDNTFAKFSPSGRLELTIANPALLGKIPRARSFYIDFTLVDEPAPAETAQA